MSPAFAQSLGSRLTRVGAALIDGLIVLVPWAILGAILPNDTSGGVSTGFWAIVSLGGLLAVFAYAPLTMARSAPYNGQTLGKQWLGLRVVHESGNPLTAGQAIIREVVGKALPNFVTCGLYGIIDHLWPLWDPGKQAVHDKIATTYVFRADADPASVRQGRGVSTPFGAQQPAVAWAPAGAGNQPAVQFQGGSVNAAQSVRWSDDGHYWWDGSAWQLLQQRLPPNAQISPDGVYFYDGHKWRPIPDGLR
ncbi:MAG TPA: RDD family protein [Solirubrobacteraceae bacterium]|jgi:uncharacterized RDD family membrane protein YckC